MNVKNDRVWGGSVKTIIASICLLFLFNVLYGQKKDPTFLDKNTFYLDLASEGAFYSLNYDRIFHQGDKLNYSYRIGFSIFNEIVALPLGINLLTGKENHHIEFSITFMPYIEEFKSFLSKNDLSDKYLYILTGIGYRYQKLEGGFYFKTAFLPMLILDPRSSDFWKMDPEFSVGFGVGAGWSF